MSMINKNVNCSYFEDLLIKKYINELTDIENNLLTEHLKSCKNCKEYQNTLNQIHYNMLIPSEGNLIPDPDIPRLASRKIKRQRQFQPATFDLSWSSILGLLKYRIPLYQLVLGISLILFVFIFIYQFNLKGNYSGEKFSTTFQGGKAIIDTVDVLKDFFPEVVVTIQGNKIVVDTIRALKDFFILDRQKIGRSVKEDSSIMQFIFTIPLRI